MYNQQRQKTKSNKIHRNRTKKASHYNSKKISMNSGNGFQTTVWGPLLWNFLHIMSFNYPVNPTYEHKVNYRNFILSLVNILPCGKCRENLCKNLINKYIYPKFLIHLYVFDKITWMHDGYYNRDQWYGKNTINCVNCECKFIKFNDNQYIEIIFNNVYYDPDNNIYTCEDYEFVPIKINNSYNSDYIEFLLDYNN
jgi:hypothetical protein